MTRTSIILLLFFFASLELFAQECTETLICRVVEPGNTDDGIPYARLTLEESETTLLSDETGYARFEGICPGQYHLLVSQVGHESTTTLITIPSEEDMVISLEIHTEFIDAVVVENEADDINSGQALAVINSEVIDRESHSSLADVIENVTGVSTLRTGSNIGKPIIHGLYGNRVSVVNNGLVQAGQQWGNDHAPEIDINTANRITVVKGVDAIIYGGNSLGGIVIVEPGQVSAEPHLHGKVNYGFSTNGLGHSLSTQVQKGSGWARWRATGTYKKSGDLKSPDYFLTNTGYEELNGALQFDKQIENDWFFSTYFSVFTTELGILRGAHISNTTDLESAIGRDEPFFTADNHSYSLNAPSQEVNHLLGKATITRFLNDRKEISVDYGFQSNHRQEFDIRRGNRSAIPALDMQLFDHLLRMKYRSKSTAGLQFVTGLEGNITENENNPDTGVLPLIPKYNKTRASVFTTVKQQKLDWEFGGGIRYELINQVADVFTRTVPVEVERFNDNFQNLSLAGGLEYDPENNYSSALNLGYVSRSPEINERFSSGLHQGVAGIEEGNADLNSEKAVKVVWSHKLKPETHSNFGIDLYHQWIQDYIYLQPDDELRLTIRGAFPVFNYEQTDATIAGLDLYGNFRIEDAWDLSMKYAFIRGNDVSNDIPLVYMPSNNLSTSIQYFLPDKGAFNHGGIQVTGKYIFEQNHLNADQDFLAPPEGYFLLEARAESTYSFKGKDIVLSLQGQNLLNSNYRDYLNRLRYYSDEPGINVNAGVRLVF